MSHKSVPQAALRQLFKSTLLHDTHIHQTNLRPMGVIAKGLWWGIRDNPGFPQKYSGEGRKGAHRALCAHCARAVRNAGCFPPPVATGPRALNSAPPILF